MTTPMYPPGYQPAQPQQPQQPQQVAQPQPFQQPQLSPFAQPLLPDPTAQPGAPIAPTPPAGPPASAGYNATFTGLDDESVKRYEFEKFEGKTGETSRIFLIRPFQIVKTRVHYHEASLKFVICNSVYTKQGEQEILTHEAQCCKVLPTASLRFGALVIHYVTDRLGQIVRPFQMPKLCLWKFGPDKYTNLRAIHREFPLDKHDISVVCSDEKYQKLQLGAARDSIYRMPNFPAQLTQQFEVWADASLPKVAREMGKTLSDLDILKALGQAGAQAPPLMAQDTPPADFSGLISGMQGPVR